MPDRYFLKGAWEKKWKPVSKADFLDAEAAAGFHNTTGNRDEPATGGFSNGSVSGKIEHSPRGHK